jgi:hypothetical protein
MFRKNISILVILIVITLSLYRLWHLVVVVVDLYHLVLFLCVFIAIGDYHLVFFLRVFVAIGGSGRGFGRSIRRSGIIDRRRSIGLGARR